MNQSTDLNCHCQEGVLLGVSHLGYQIPKWNVGYSWSTPDTITLTMNNWSGPGGSRAWDRGTRFVFPMHHLNLLLGRSRAPQTPG